MKREAFARGEETSSGTGREAASCAREITLGVLDGCGPDEKLEVRARESQSGRLELELRALAWGEGIGWYPQRTIPLPGDLRQLSAVLHWAARLTGRPRESEMTRKVVALPAAGARRAKRASA